MKNRTEWITFAVFVIAVLGALGFLLRRGVHGQSAALAVALLVILLSRSLCYTRFPQTRQASRVHGKSVPSFAISSNSRAHGLP
jgi:hypothetical protein